MVEYMKNQSGKIIGVIWDNKKSANMLIGGIVLLAVLLTGIAWWKMQPSIGLRQPTGLRRLNTGCSSCHTCGGG